MSNLCTQNKQHSLQDTMCLSCTVLLYHWEGGGVSFHVGRQAYLLCIISYFIIAVNHTALIPACFNYYILTYLRVMALLSKKKKTKKKLCISQQNKNYLTNNMCLCVWLAASASALTSCGKLLMPL